MKSHIEIQYLRNGSEIGKPVVMNVANIHPDITDAVSWDDILNALKVVGRYLLGDTAGAIAEAKKQLEKHLSDALKSKNFNQMRQGDLQIPDSGRITGLSEAADEVIVTFYAWSEDDLTKCFATISPVDRVKDLGEKRFKRGDDNWYEHSFSIPLGTVRPGSYVFNCAAGDDGWHFDVGVASILVLTIIGTCRQSSSFIQSRFGARGNFDLVVPRTSGGLAFYWRDNDKPEFPWNGPAEISTNVGKVDAAALIQSNFGTPGLGNFDMVARIGDRLAHFWREDRPPFTWHGPLFFASGVSGVPAFIQSRFGARGNFDLVVPRTSGGLAFYWRDNDKPEFPWNGPVEISTNVGKVDAVALIQSNFGTPGLGNFDMVARIGDRLAHFWREDRPPFTWHGPLFFASGVSGVPAFIQSRFGARGNFDLVVPRTSGGLAFYWRDNDKPEFPWNGPAEISTNVGKVDAAALIQSNFGTPGLGNFDMVARIGNRLAHFWREDRAPFTWHGPFFFASGV